MNESREYVFIGGENDGLRLKITGTHHSLCFLTQAGPKERYYLVELWGNKFYTHECLTLGATIKKLLRRYPLNDE